MANFDAFISYSRSADGVLAPKIRDGLQQLNKPWNKRRALNIFLDRASLEVSSGLKESLHAKLDDSDWLILLLSEDCAKSEWVGAEIDNWVATKPKDRLVLVHTDGELCWGNSDWDWVRSTAVPRALSGVYDEEPLWLDLREYRDSADLDVRSNTAFKDDLATLAAPLHGLPKEELVGADLVQYRKSRRLWRIAVTGLVVLTIAAITLAIIALIARDRAVKAEAEAVKEAKIATARQLAAQARLESPDQSDLGWLLAVASKDLDDQLLDDRDIDTSLVEPASALIGTLEDTPALIGYLPLADPATTVAAAPGSPVIATGDATGAVTIWDPATRQPLDVIELDGAVSAMAMSDDGSVVAVGTEGGEVTVWDRTEDLRFDVPGPGVPIVDLAFDFGAFHVAVASRTETGENVTIHAVGTGEQVGAGLTDLIAVRAMEFDGQFVLRVIDWSEQYECQLARECFAVGLDPEYLPLARPGPSAFNVSADLGATSQLTGGTITYGALSGSADRFVELGAGFIDALAFSPDGSALAAVHESTLSFWNTSTAEEIGEPMPGVEPGVNTLIVFPTADGSQVATLAGGKVQLWGRDRTTRLGVTLPVSTIVLPSVAEGVVSAAVSPNGERVAWLIDLPGGFGRTGEDVVLMEGESIAVLDTNTGDITTLAPDGEYLAFSRADNLIAFRGEDVIVTDAEVAIDLVDGSEVSGVAIECVDFDATVPTAGGGLARCDGGVAVAVDLDAFGDEVARVDLAGAVFSEDGSRLAVFDPSTREATLYGVDESPVVIDLSGDPALLDAIGLAGEARPILELSPDGELLVVASWEGGTYSFRSADGTLVLSQPRGKIQSLAFSPDGRLVAFDQPGGGIEVRDTADLGVVTVLDGDGGTPNRMLVFLPDGTMLVEAVAGGGLTLWDLDPASWAESACDAAARTLTADERRRLIPDSVDVAPCEPTAGSDESTAEPDG